MIQARRAAGVLAALFAFVVFAAPAWAAPSFPRLSGRVVDEANILPPAVEAELTGKLQALDTATGRQLVVVTLASLQGYEIEEYGYQLGRAWGVGTAERDDGAVFIVAPNERAVRIEVGYGLEGVLTDALSSIILQTRVLPAFRNGDMAGGVVAGTDAIVEQLSLEAPEAQQRVAAAAEAQSGADEPPEWVVILIVLIIFLVMRGMFGGRRRGRYDWIAPVIISGGSRRGGGFGGGGFGGGGFSGGGGSFGGGGASGRW